MEIDIINPVDQTAQRLSVEPEDYNGTQALRIIFPNKDSFVMAEEQGEWNVLDETDINPQLIEAIAEGLKTHARYT